MKYFLVGVGLLQISLAGEVPTIHFHDKVTWHQIFESGIRPKHFVGLERNKCISENQEFVLRFKNRNERFHIGPGRISFSFYYDDFLSMIWHQSSERITLEEGRIRANEFRNLFDGHIVQEITMPRLIDPSGLVDAGNDENNVKARVGEYLIWYGFDNSMRKDRQLIPHFYIAWSFPGRPDVRLKDVRDVVRPPKGYEWYSLDPKVHTPDPDASSINNSNQTQTVPNQEVVQDAESEKVRIAHSPSGGSVTMTSLAWWFVWCGFLLICSIFSYVRFRSRRRTIRHSRLRR